jgi:hypothetical protein
MRRDEFLIQIAITRCNGAIVSAIDDGRSGAATRTKKFPVLPLPIRGPALRLIARAREIARVRLPVSARRTWSCASRPSA